MEARLKVRLSCPRGPPNAVHVSSKPVDPEPVQNTQKVTIALCVLAGCAAFLHRLSRQWPRSQQTRCWLGCHPQVHQMPLQSRLQPWQHTSMRAAGRRSKHLWTAMSSNTHMHNHALVYVHKKHVVLLLHLQCCMQLPSWAAVAMLLCEQTGLRWLPLPAEWWLCRTLCCSIWPSVGRCLHMCNADGPVRLHQGTHSPGLSCPLDVIYVSWHQTHNGATARGTSVLWVLLG